MIIRLLLSSILIVGLTSCSVDEPFYIFNGTGGTVLVEVEGGSHSIKQGATKKVRGLHHSGGSITFSNGTRKNYDNSLKDLLVNWMSLRSKYICDGFWSAEFHVNITRSGALELQPCLEENDPIVLQFDEA